jgi:selenocysteine lyase/cysteine desulfurase
MIEKLDESSFSLISGDYSSRLEAGLQDFAGIIGLGASIDWLNSYKPEGLNQKNHQQKLAEMVFKEVSSLPNVNVLNTKPSSTISFYSEDIDSHRLATFLSQQNIMTRSGYFCCHYFLQNVKKYPPLLRVSIGLHNTEEDIRKFIEVINKIVKNIQ